MKKTKIQMKIKLEFMLCSGVKMISHVRSIQGKQNLSVDNEL